MQTNINFLSYNQIESLRVGDRLSDKTIEGKIVEIYTKKSTGWGITFSFMVENENGRRRIVSREC